MEKIPTYKDERGTFIPFKGGCDQFNVSINPNKYTFRGMHYQTNPPQTKTIKVIQGSVLDFLYDLDTKELKIYNLDITNEVFVDKNYAHGFLTLEDNTIFTYSVTGEYSPESEHSIVWDTIPGLKKIINDTVGDNELIISDKDKNGK